MCLLCYRNQLPKLTERIKRHKRRTKHQAANTSEIRLPVQELQVGDLSALIVRAPLSLLLNETHKGLNQAELQHKYWMLQAEKLSTPTDRHENLYEKLEVFLTASALSSSLTAWMVSLHSASRVSYKCSLVSSFAACSIKINAGNFEGTLKRTRRTSKSSSKSLSNRSEN